MNKLYGSNKELDEKINSGNVYVREAVAKQGYGLDKLINDECYLVRAEVALQGYGLDKLANDEDDYVREIAREKLKERETK